MAPPNTAASCVQGPPAPMNKTDDETLAGAPPGAGPGIRADLQLVADLVEPGSRVLDVGCGDGTLLYYLSHFKGVDGRGLEISQEGVNACVSQGLSVIQGNAETDLRDYPSQAFDYVILSQTLQAIHAPREVLVELMRIGQRAIVSITNIGYWRLRWHLLWRGRMPVTNSPGRQWYDTPTIHHSTIKDFVTLCQQLGITIERCHSVARSGKTHEVRPSSGYANLLGHQAVFLLG